MNASKLLAMQLNKVFILYLRKTLKNMKKYLIVAAALFAVACKNDDTKAKEQATETKTSSNPLYGKWKVVGVSVNNETRQFAPGTMEFKENGEYKGITGGIYKFMINGDSLLLYNSENKITDRSKIILSEVEKGTLKLQTLVKDTLHIETVFQKEN
jgi:hypothetical protein